MSPLGKTIVGFAVVMALRIWVFCGACRSINSNENRPSKVLPRNATRAAMDNDFVMKVLLGNEAS